MAGRVRKKKQGAPDPWKRLEVHLEPDGFRVQLAPGFSAALFVQGALQGEFGLGAQGPEDLREELRRARASQAACEMMRDILKELGEQRRKPDHVVKSDKRSAAYAEGLEAGLNGEHRVIGKDPQFSIDGSVVAPKSKLNGPSYMRGWSLGAAIWAAITMAKTGKDPRKEWK